MSRSLGLSRGDGGRDVSQGRLWVPAADSSARPQGTRGRCPGRVGAASSAGCDAPGSTSALESGRCGAPPRPAQYGWGCVVGWWQPWELLAEIVRRRSGRIVGRLRHGRPGHDRRAPDRCKGALHGSLLSEIGRLPIAVGRWLDLPCTRPGRSTCPGVGTRGGSSCGAGCAYAPALFASALRSASITRATASGGHSTPAEDIGTAQYEPHWGSYSVTISGGTPR